MQGSLKHILLGVAVGLVLLSLVVSMDFVYYAPRVAVATVVYDNMANIALIPNDNHLQGPAGYFAYIGKDGDLHINFGYVAPNTVEVLSDVFYIKNNLNQPVTITVDPKPHADFTVYVSYSPNVNPSDLKGLSTDPTITLGPGQEVAVTLILFVGQVPPGTQIVFPIYVLATYHVGNGQ